MSRAVHLSQATTSPLSQLIERITPYQAEVQQHSLYHRLDTIAAIRYFMASHAFAVWDNMLLLKTLQQRLTCVTTPWHPPADAIAARLINEIILDEESEEISPGQYMSHMEFYLAAMEEIGADTQAITVLMNKVRNGESIERAIALSSTVQGSPISPSVQPFVLHTWRLCQGPTPAVVAAFLLAREAIVSPLFFKILDQLKQIEAASAQPCDLLKAYCQRHLYADEERHIPLGLALLNRICGNDAAAWAQAEEAAISSLVMRKALWDSLSTNLLRP